MPQSTTATPTHIPETFDSITLGGDLTVHRIGLGTNRITDTPEAREVLCKAVELGVNFIDTADLYQFHESELMIAKTLSPFPKGIVIATKGGMMPPTGKANGRPEYLKTTLDGSLMRLNLSCIDLYQLHRIDPNVPVEESVGFLKEMQQAGKIRHIGVSEVTVDQLERARAVAEIVSVQNQYNITERKHEDVLEYCEANGIVFIPWYPIAKGSVSSIEVIASMAERYRITPVQLSLAWLLKRSKVMLPIPGTLSVEHLRANLAASSVQLSEKDFATLSAIEK